ncbi:MAG TPA: BadF/BadG/BcrA/BcrD ATPase family protein [Bacillota bacterium]|nr:ATPase [Bacillota bacterium]HOA36034.1 BadF/BadG/BcrA/BcrD ATPase family protein [Bacillota bacterium]HPZ12066.1 BadF/BadG/BcrA/BcrD ATPase family protein [Bacillota bacterium]HQE10652.1 BadF/BadG/BcrA/BcrD ATPase family protein [Bacillota bacterium]
MIIISSEKKRYYAGVDGGATKTLALCGDGEGSILGVGMAGPSNYQVVGAAAAMQAVAEALETALRQAGIERKDLAYTVFALSGADLPADFELLQKELTENFPRLSFQLVNDCWAAFRAGTDAAFGAVSICGTGTNAAARNRNGAQAALRSLGYECGNWGGAADLAREALHHAFRSEEGTGPKSRLEEEVLAAFDGEFSSYSELALALRDDLSLKIRSIYLLPVVVFRLASKGDAEAQEILIRMGAAAGGDCAAVIKTVGMENEPCDVVLAGGMYAAARQHNPLLIDSFRLALHRAVPGARLKLPLFEPAVGAYLLAAGKDGRLIRHSGSDAAAARLARTYKELELPIPGQESK